MEARSCCRRAGGWGQQQASPCRAKQQQIAGLQFTVDLDAGRAVGGAARSLHRTGRGAGGLALEWRELEAAVGVHVGRKKGSDQDLVHLQNKMVDPAVGTRVVEAGAAERDARRGVRGAEAEGTGWRLPWGASQHGGSGARGVTRIFAFCDFLF